MTGVPWGDGVCHYCYVYSEWPEYNADKYSDVLKNFVDGVQDDYHVTYEMLDENKKRLTPALKTEVYIMSSRAFDLDEDGEMIKVKTDRVTYLQSHQDYKSTLETEIADYRFSKSGFDPNA